MGRFPWLMRYASWLMLIVFGVSPLLWYFYRLARAEPTPGEGIAWVGIAVIGVAIFLISQITMITTEFGLTTEKLVVKRGVISRSTNEIPLSAVENINLHQTVFSRLFGYGRLELNGSGGSSLWSHPVQNPLALRTMIAEAMNKASRRRGFRAKASSIDFAHNGDRKT